MHHAHVLPKRFHLNGHTIGFRPKTQNLELHVSIIDAGSEGLRPKKVKIININLYTWMIGFCCLNLYWHLVYYLING